MKIAVCLLLFALSAAASELPTAPELLQQSMDYHDPDGVLLQSSVRLTIEAGYADGTKQIRVCSLDYRNYDFEMVQTLADGTVLERFAREDGCGSRIDGREPTAEEAKKHALSCERSQMYRNYMSYLWGLPMKLADAGTQLEPTVKRSRFQDRDVLELTVRYDPEIGSDIWYFYLDPESARLVGYAFTKGPEHSGGEYIVLSEELQLGSVRLPARRAWYTFGDDAFLGADLLSSLEFIMD